MLRHVPVFCLPLGDLEFKDAGAYGVLEEARQLSFTAASLTGEELSRAFVGILGYHEVP